MNDEDFVMGYAVGFNDGVGSGGSGGLDDYPVFPKRFRLGDSDFSFLVGDINTGFYDSLIRTQYNSTTGTYDFKNAVWYRSLCVILCKGNERFAVFNANGQTPVRSISSPGTDGSYLTSTHYLDDISCAKIAPSSSTGEWRYQMVCECHYDDVYSDGRPGYTGTNTYTNYLYQNLSFNEDGTVKKAPSEWVYYTHTFKCLNEGYYAELMNLMLTVPDIIEEVF